NFKYQEKDNAAFLADLKKITQNYKTQSDFKLNIKNATWPTYFTAQNASFSYKGEPNQDSFNNIATLSADKVSSELYKVQFTRFNLDLLLSMTSSDDFYSALLCSQHIYKLLCMNNLSTETYTEQRNNIFTRDMAKIDATNFAVDIDTFPATDKTQPVTGRLEIIPPPPKQAEKYFSVFKTFNQSEINATLSVPMALINDMYATEPDNSAKLKADSSFWHILKKTFAPDNPFIQLAATDNGLYEFNFVQKDGKHWLNGKDMDNIEEQAITPNENSDALPATDSPAETLHSETETGKENQPQAVNTPTSDNSENMPKSTLPQTDESEKIPPKTP
ncbi:MAG TPA: hypothetical protein DD638_11030, partial [Pasteurellaceae bacterium]|nr:hypothetical protein [Pasteurellaceae bacterium]